MGANQSSQQVLNNTLNSVSMQVMTKNSTAVSGSIVSENDLLISNVSGTTISNFVQSNSSKINVQALLKSVQDNTLQAELISKLSSAIQQEVPVLAVGDDTKQKVVNSVTNAINSNITTENFQNISAQVYNKNSAIINNVDTSTFNNITQSNEASLILSLVNDTNSQIIDSLKATSTEAADVLQKQAPILDLSAGSIFLIVVVVLLLGGGYYVYSTQKDITGFLAENYIYLGIGVVLIILIACLLYYEFPSSSSSSSSKPANGSSSFYGSPGFSKFYGSPGFSRFYGKKK
jgi:hypothetical protein